MNDGVVEGYQLATEQDFTEFMKFCCDDEGWNLCVESKDVKVWDKSDGENAINMVKLWGRIPILADVCYDVLHDPEYRKTWDENMFEGYNIEVLDAFNDVGYYSAKSPFPFVSGRDFCNQRCWWSNGENRLIINHSVEHKDCPLNKNFVRAKSIRTGYWIKPDEEDDQCSIITYVTQTDMCGSIPTWMVNKVTKSFAPKMVENLMKVCPKYPEWKEKNSPEDKPWLAEGEKCWWEDDIPHVKKESKKKERKRTEETTLSPKKKNDRSKSQETRHEHKKVGRSAKSQEETIPKEMDSSDGK